MLTHEIIEKEVKKVFGEDVKVTTGYEINMDGYFIEVLKRTREGAIKATAFISGLEELQYNDPIGMLRLRIKAMNEEFKLELKKHIDTVISEKMREVSNAEPLWQEQLSQYSLIKDRKASE